MRILALEPYYGGSHRHVLDGLVQRIDAEWTLLTLPPRKWKWRMRGSAITMAEEVRSLGSNARFGLIFASTFVNLAEFRGLAPSGMRDVPAVVYFHENQLVYPNRHTAEWDYQFPLTNITSALSAECCVFNTEWNRARFLAEIPAFMGEFPDYRPKGLAEAIEAHSVVLAPPFDPSAFDAHPPKRGERCRIVWPHRWEHDKNPEEFFKAVTQLAEEGLDFEVVVAGQSFKETSAEMRDAASSLGDRLVHCDEPADRDAYAELLAGSDIAVSTALNEFFGLAMVEACYAGCHPLVPRRLAYPEIYGDEHLYDSRDALVARLRELVLHPPAPMGARAIAERYTFDALIDAYRALFESVAAPR